MRTVDQIKQSEHDRLAFMENRDGVAEMLVFAKQTYGVYRAARRRVLGRMPPYGKAFRKELIVACVVLRQVLRKAK